MGGSISILQVTCVWTLRPFDGWMMYTDIECEYHSHLSTTFNLTLNCPPILTHARKSTEGPYHIYVSDS